MVFASLFNLGQSSIGVSIQGLTTGLNMITIFIFPRDLICQNYNNGKSTNVGRRAMHVINSSLTSYSCCISSFISTQTPEHIFSATNEINHFYNPPATQHCDSLECHDIFLSSIS